MIAYPFSPIACPFSSRSERWRYIRYVDGSEELYDHDSDPNEWHNLAGEPSMNSVKKQHAEWIDRLTEGEKRN